MAACHERQREWPSCYQTIWRTTTDLGDRVSGKVVHGMNPGKNLAVEEEDF